MKRLTKRCNGVVTYIGASNEYETGQIACEVSPQGVRELLDRLAAFEDTEMRGGGRRRSRRCGTRWTSITR